MFNKMRAALRCSALCSVMALAGCTGDDGATSAQRGGGSLSAEQCDHFAQGGRVTICHATGSARNPFVLIRVAESACVSAHSSHAGDYVSTDGTCGPGACLPVGGPVDPTLGCCPGLVAVNGVCTDLCAGVTCAAADGCHVAGTCNPMTGACSNPNAPDGTRCSDGSLCTDGDVCAAGSCAGTPAVLDDGNPCTADACTPAGGVTHVPLAAGMACGDGDLCNGNEACDGMGTCAPGAPVATDDGNPCTADSCNATTGLAEHTPVADGLSCNDGDACTQADSCRAGACGGAPVVCAPLDDCHVAGVCNPMSGVCTNPAAADRTACGAGLACAAGVCSDVDECAANVDNCSANATCTNTMGSFACACNAGYTGDGVTCAAVPPAPRCGDGVVNQTTELCDRGALNGVTGSGCLADCRLEASVRLSARIHEHCSSASTSIEFTQDTATLNWPSYLNRPSYVTLGANTGIIVYSGLNFTGQQRTFTTSTNFCSVAYPNGAGVNDNVASFQLFYVP